MARATRFDDRHDAGRRLAALVAQRDLVDPLVLALPRGGVPVGYEVAMALGAPLEVFVSRKVGAPGRPEFGIGAIAEGSSRPILGPQAGAFGLTDHDLDVLIAVERDEIQRQIERYRDGQSLPALASRTVILVDDGLATGVTAEAALVALWEAGATEVVLAAPCAAADTSARLAALAEVITVMEPPFFAAVGRWYRQFDQTTDTEVLDLLSKRSAWAPDITTPEVEMEIPDTVSDAVRLLAERGYEAVFELGSHGVRSSDDATAVLGIDTIVVDHTFRFEGDTDPADAAIVLGIRCSTDDSKGVLVAAYGPDVAADHARLLAALSEDRG